MEQGSGHREADHLRRFERTNYQRVLENSEYMGPPVTVETAVDSDYFEGGRFQHRDGGPDQ
jgi:hypothetical protein